MARSRLACVVALLTVVPLSGGCRRESRPEPTVPPPAPAAPALPSGHPPLAPDQGGHGSAPVGAGGLSWTKPEGWVEERPSSAMRRAQYRVPGPGGDAECVVFYFGAGEGGDPQSNAERWAGQFTRPDGKPAPMKTTPLTAGGAKVVLVEVEGTYHGGPTMGGAAAGPKGGYMLLGAIAEGPDANWFFKFTGPAQTVRGHRPSFEAMIRSLKKATPV